MELDFRLLQTFTAVAKAGSISRAAETMRIAQSAVSRKITQLERAVGLELFIRQPNGVGLTSAGRHLLDAAEPLLAQFDQLKDSLAAVAQGGSAKVDLGFTASTTFLLEGVIARFRASHPNVRLHFTEGGSLNLHEWVMSGRLDLAVITNPLPSPLLKIRPLWTEAVFLVEAASRPDRGLAGLRDLPFILTSRSDGVRETMEKKFAEAGLPFTVFLEMEPVTSVKPMVAAGKAFTILPHSIITKEVAEGSLRATPLNDAVITRALVWRASAPFSPAMKAFVKALKLEIGDKLSDVTWAKIAAEGNEP
jgi:LysR family nitrogen assimilation transcriptional regulator